MARRYIYTVTNKRTGEPIATGTISKCAKATGLDEETLRGMTLGKHDTYITPAKRKYIITREKDRDTVFPTAKYYSVYCKKTDQLLASGTSEECVKAMGWKNIGTLRRLMTREKSTGKTGYEFYSEPYYQNEEDNQ